MQTYDEFINSILETRGRFACGEAYHERHHIIPKSCGGTNDESNLIDLYAREHFEAHRLLALEYPHNQNLICAWWMMSHIGRIEITADEYEEARIVFCNIQREARIGTTLSKEIRQKISESHIGEKNINYGVPRTKEVRQKISESNKKYWTKENIQKQQDRAKEYCTDTWRQNNGNAHKKKIIQYTKDNVFVCEWDSVKSAGEILHINRSNISSCLNDRLKTAGGFIWRYKENINI